MTHEPQHTWTLDKNSLPVSIYTKVWGFSAENVNFCKLFWAFVLLPIGLIYLGFQNFFSGVASGVRWVEHKFPSTPIPPKEHSDEWHEIRKLRGERSVINREIRRLKKSERARKRQEFFEKLAGFFSPKADRVAAFFQAHDWIGAAFIIIAAIVGVILIIFSVIHDPVTWAWIAGSFVVGIAVIYTLMLLSDKGVLGKASQKFTHGIGNTASFLGTGFKAVKDRTCPAVVVPGVTSEEEKVNA